MKAAQKLKKTNSDMSFVWISNSKLNEEDLQKVKNFGLDEDFVLITSEQVGTEHIDLFILLRLAGIFSLPSFVEGLPISLLEAMALGIPSVSSNINGIPEAVKHLETGYLIEPGNIQELVNAIQTLKDKPDLRGKLSKNGREYVLTNFSQQKVAKIAAENYIKSFQEN
jgi:glycosyltransferase involved in cell wall biosynthesis